jgi:putative glutamine amidotransferase
MPARVLVAGPAKRDSYLKSYLEALRSVGAEPACDWPTAEELSDRALLRRFLAKYDGLLLPGGADVEPWRYGEDARPEVKTTDAELDEGEIALARLALEDDYPTLAICRGIQVVGVAVGASLYQDLPSQVASRIDHQVRTTQTTLAHDVETTSGSRLDGLVKARRFSVNSRHHQAVREVVSGSVGPLTVVARAEDGVVEGIESTSHPFYVGVQWHPENLVFEQLESRGVLLGFVEACRA